MLRRLAAFALLAAVPSLAGAQSSSDAARVESAHVRSQRLTTVADAKRLLGALAADSMEGRAIGTRGAYRAARYIASEMKRIGIASLGDSGYFQKVPVAMSVGAGGRAGRPRLLPGFADLDTVPPERRRTEVNVLGVIRGSDPVLREEVVIVDGHYDHLGIRAPAVVGGDSIYNGADDDASGITAVLEMARQLKQGPPPRRTVVFAAMTGEEAGLVGVTWYIGHPALPLGKTVANLEIEMIDRPDSLSFGSGKAWLTGFERSTMGEIFQAAGLLIFPDRRPEQNFFSRSDNIGFARRGIVAHTLSTFALHSDYHRVTDDVDKADFDHMAGVINTAARAVRLLADGPKPTWKPSGQPEFPTTGRGRGRGGD